MLTIRPATKEDIPRLAALAGALVRMHNAVDARRFMLPPNVEDGYGWWFTQQLENADAVIVVAEDAGRVLGYAYGSKEPRDWNMLLDEHAALHDVYVDEVARKRGVGKMLVLAAIDRFEKLGCVRVVLSTMVSNEAAKKLFAACGFRPTMLEMTRGG